MAVILPIDNVACQFEVLDGHVVHVTEQPLEIVHHVKLSVGRIRSHVHNRSGIIHIFIFDLVVRDHLGVLVALDANIARVILVLMFFEDFEWCRDFTLPDQLELTVLDYVIGKVIYFVTLQLTLDFIGDLSILEEPSDVQPQRIGPVENLEVAVVDDIINLGIFDLLTKVIFFGVHECFDLVFKDVFMSIRKFFELTRKIMQVGQIIELQYDWQWLQLT